MNENSLAEYKAVRESGGGLFEFPGRGLIEVSGSEAVMFLDGLISNDVKTLEENTWMRASFPNVQGRLLAVVRVLKSGGKFYFDTERATADAVFANLERFTLAGDFLVENLSAEFVCFAVQGREIVKQISDLGFQISNEDGQIVETDFAGGKVLAFKDSDIGAEGFYFWVSADVADKFREELKEQEGLISVSADAFEVLRVEAGLPVYGIDMDDTTVVPETALPGLISYNKGCYIGQEVIARIHFRGRVAKQLSGIVFEDPSSSIESLVGGELKSADDKNAGRITSVAYSPKLEKVIALGYVRSAFLEEGTELSVGGVAARVKNLPFVK